ncbi:MAG: 3'(2'),5'-bisphosphate nucleotidase CysQ [Pseudomonadota bacterium]
MNYENILPDLIQLAKQAGKAIMEVYQQKTPVDVKIKADKTPVTQADLIAHQVIKNKLQQLTPEIPILSEEAANIDFSERKKWHTYWLIDPLDGTKEFIQRTDEFTVNIALIAQHHSVLGVVYAPVLDWCYYASRSTKAYKIEAQQPPHEIKVRQAGDKLTVALSRRHGHKEFAPYLEKIRGHEIIKKGSSLKSCLIAEGKADIYASMGPTSEWDTGASQCIVEVAGGRVCDLEFNPLCYNTKASLINPPFIVVGDASYNWKQFFNKL